ncbi:hypothetical protein S40285_09422 [Stachybotrys chlorohalonatus IBT 40285]|uniref:FAD-binding PCMH-type domain-containing protein n=1 Tax=Stachybotrys chlorohalonatus (strain IBT 40285) TaxID=1283841 RepID=A0A084QWI8_STAC4|nr:hypothetical protein S40285_09422 [Stachybotrys chlorohalonata IBT 40285]
MVRLHNLVAVAALWADLSAAQYTGYKNCDALIDAGLGDSLLLHNSSAGSPYLSSIGSYYSFTAREILPWCILQPKDAEEVSLAVQALAQLPATGRWNIAVRGGGHSAWLNNNIAQGVTIDLSLLNTTRVRNSTCLSDGNSIASIGAGSRWASAVTEVERYGLGLTGGRVAGVGVAGLTLGGGASFHSGRRGFACDDVVNYEVVLADGRIVNANSRVNPDLFKALKGGGGNFGIVTRFDMVAFPAPQLYGGYIMSSWDQFDPLVDGFINVISTSSEYTANSQIFLMNRSPGSPMPLIGSIPVNTDGDENSPPFDYLNDVPLVFDMRAKQTYGELVTSMSDNGGQRQYSYVWFSLCFHNDKRMIEKARDLFLGLLEDTEEESDVTVMFVFQPLPKHYAREGNVLGLDKTLTDDSLIWLGEAFVNTPAQEALFQAKLAVINAELEAFAVSIDANTQWRYLNYVNPSQDPFSSYGAENVQFLKNVSLQYDPTGFFQHRVSGGFKISAVE